MNKKGLAYLCFGASSIMKGIGRFFLGTKIPIDVLVIPGWCIIGNYIIHTKKVKHKILSGCIEITYYYMPDEWKNEIEKLKEK